MKLPMLFVVLLLPVLTAAADQTAQDQLDVADGYFSRGFFKEATEEYATYLERHPEGEGKLRALYRLGVAAYAGKDYEKALEAFQQLTDPGGSQEEHIEAALKKGEVLYYLERYKAAAAALKPLTAPDVEGDIRSRALYYSAKSRASAGDTEAAASLLEQLINGFPGTELGVYGRYQLAFIHLERDRLEDAAIEFSAVAASKVDATLRMESRYRAAEIYDKIGWFSAAVKAYEQLRTEFPGTPYARRAEYGYAWALFHAGRYAEAIVAGQAFNKSHQDSPYGTGLAYLIANCQQQQKNYAGALRGYMEIREKHPDSEFAARAAYKVPWVYYLQGNLGKAKTEVRAFLERNKDSPKLGDAAFLLGSILMGEGNYQDAQQEFRLVAEKYPESEFGVEAGYKAAECLSHLGLSARAAELFENFVQQHPDHPFAAQAVLRAGDARFDVGDYAAAAKRYNQILKEKPDPAVEGKTLYRLALAHHNLRDYPKSAAVFKQLLDRIPESYYRAEAQFRVAESLLRDEDNAVGAIALYESCLKSAPEGPFAGPATRGIALARYEQKDFGRAADAFLEVMRNSPGTPLNEETYAWAGQHFFDAKQWDAAATAFEALLSNVKDYPNPERVRFKIAECAEGAGNKDDALERYQAVVGAAPASAKATEARFRMAGIYEEKKEIGRAIALYEAAADANVGDLAARARFRLGELHEERKEYNKAARSFMHVAIMFLHEELSPESLWRAGRCYEQAGQMEQARLAFEELTADFPDSEFAKKAKAALEKLAAAEAEAPQPGN